MFKLKKISDVCEVIMGQSPSSETYNDKQIGMPFFQGKAEFGELYPTARLYCSKPLKVANENDILMSVRAPVGDVNISNIQCCIGRGLAAIRPDNSKINSKFLYYLLKYKKNEIEYMGTGSTFKAISRNHITDILIPVPHLNNQVKIVNALDKAQSLINKRKAQIEALDQLTQSIFLEMFGDPGSNPNKFPKEKIKNLGRVVTGNTPSMKNPEYYGEFIEWIKSDNINTPSHYLTSAKKFLSELGLKKGREVPPNSILVTCIAGSKSCIGNAAMANRRVAFNQQINAIVPGSDINHYFLYAQLLVGKRLVQQASTNGMKGLVSKSSFEQIELIKPAYNLQKKYGEVFAEIEKQKESLILSLNLLEENYTSLIQRAFKGELFKEEVTNV